MESQKGKTGESKSTLIVMCNGPSLKDQDFDLIAKYPSLGLNAAYRYYRKHNFWPTYFACFDHLVCDFHRPEYEKMMTDPDNQIQKFFFIDYHKFSDQVTNPTDTLSKLQKLQFKRIIPFENIKQLSQSFSPLVDLGCTGANAVQVGILLGYRKIILLGCDANYVPVVDGAKSYDEKAPHKLEMEKTPPTNPNYWFDDYQVKGDRFNLPKPEVFHIPAWERLANLCPSDVEIVNCSSITKVKCFRISTLEAEVNVQNTTN